MTKKQIKKLSKAYARWIGKTLSAEIHLACLEALEGAREVGPVDESSPHPPLSLRNAHAVLMNLLMPTIDRWRLTIPKSLAHASAPPVARARGKARK
jgi:hypothetical protein